jgi:hypothetical protein
MSVLTSVEAEIAEMPVEMHGHWRAEVARALAREMVDDPNASIARELRAVMRELRESRPAEKGTVSDELKSRREAGLAGRVRSSGS